jgi:hypothetical protein
MGMLAEPGVLIAVKPLKVLEPITLFEGTSDGFGIS